METTGTPPLPSDRVVRDGLAAADRRRRFRTAQHQIWRAAPLVAGLALALAALVRWLGWPRPLPIAVLVAGGLALAVYAWFARRAKPVTDSAAAAIDRDADLGGELRSAAWFANRQTRDEWAELHVRRAADRMSQLDWVRLYPAVRARRAQFGAVAIGIAAALLALTAPERVYMPPAEAARPADRPLGPVNGEMLVLTPELQQQLEALLAAAQQGDAAAIDKLSSSEELRELLEKLSAIQDPTILEALARAVAETRGEQLSALEAMEALAERARQAADSNMLSPTLQEALEKLAGELEVAQPELAQNAGAQSGAEQEGDDSAGGAGAQPNVSIQFTRDAAAEGASLMMTSTANQQGLSAPGGGGFGGAGGSDTSAPTPGIEAALKQEFVEASQDAPGKNVEAEIIRKTEHGTASVAFTGSAAAEFDRATAAAPPPVPEARRTTVQTYFVRKPQ